MISKIKKIALAGAFALVAAPAFAQVPPQINPTGIDLDPLHIFTPVTPAPPPMVEPAPRRHRAMHRRMMKKRMMKKAM